MAGSSRDMLLRAPRSPDSLRLPRNVRGGFRSGSSRPPRSPVPPCRPPGVTSPANARAIDPRGGTPALHLLDNTGSWNTCSRAFPPGSSAPGRKVSCATVLPDWHLLRPAMIAAPSSSPLFRRIHDRTVLPRMTNMSDSIELRYMTALSVFAGFPTAWQWLYGFFGHRQPRRFPSLARAQAVEADLRDRRDDPGRLLAQLPGGHLPFPDQAVRFTDSYVIDGDSCDT